MLIYTSPLSFTDRVEPTFSLLMRTEELNEQNDTQNVKAALALYESRPL